MAVFSVLSQERIDKMEDLQEIIESSVEKIYAIDEALEQLVKGGLKGSAVETMAGTYRKNRETINELIILFAKYYVELKTQEERITNLNRQAEENAAGTPIQ